jgi:hypothetical protein
VEAARQEQQEVSQSLLPVRSLAGGDVEALEQARAAQQAGAAAGPSASPDLFCDEELSASPSPPNTLPLPSSPSSSSSSAEKGADRRDGGRTVAEEAAANAPPAYRGSPAPAGVEELTDDEDTQPPMGLSQGEGFDLVTQSTQDARGPSPQSLQSPRLTQSPELGRSARPQEDGETEAYGDETQDVCMTQDVGVVPAAATPAQAPGRVGRKNYVEDDAGLELYDEEERQEEKGEGDEEEVEQDGQDDEEGVMEEEEEESPPPGAAAAEPTPAEDPRPAGFAGPPHADELSPLLSLCKPWRKRARGEDDAPPAEQPAAAEGAADDEATDDEALAAAPAVDPVARRARQAPVALARSS